MDLIKVTKQLTIGGARTLYSSPFSSGFPSGKINKHRPRTIDNLQMKMLRKPNPMKSHGFIIIFPITIAINLHRPMITFRWFM